MNKSSISPLRNKENCSPQRASPGPMTNFVPVDDPIERRSLLAQLDELKQRLHYDYTKDNEEVQQVRRDKDIEIHDILAKKDALVEESHSRIHTLKREIEKEEERANMIRDENVLMQK